MRDKIITTLLCACVFMLTSATAFAVHYGGGSTESTSFDFWWYSDSALATFLNSSHPGVNIITPSGLPDSNASTITSKGYTLMGGLGGYAAQWAQGYPSSSDVAAIEGNIDKIAAEGGKMIFVNEPYPAPNDPADTATSPMSIAYNVKGFNILYSYMQSKHPGMKFGLVIGDDGGAPLHLAMLTAGLHEDFSAIEYYNACCAGSTNPFTAQKTAFPNVLTMFLVYNTETLCQTNTAQTTTWLPTNSVDIWGFWDLDNYGGWIGPFMDASWRQNASTFASTGSVTSFCQLPVSAVAINQWTWNTQTANFTISIGDGYYWRTTTLNPLMNTSNAITSCDYQVMSGANAINGPNDPSVTVTLPWTQRTCNGNLTITVGTNGNCNLIGAKTCLVFTRAHTASGAVGNVTYQEYSIDY